MTEWAKKKYNEYYTSYVPWLEDKYLEWFGENKTSYTAKGEPVASLSLPLSLSLSHTHTHTRKERKKLLHILSFLHSIIITINKKNSNSNSYIYIYICIDKLKSTKITGDKNIDAIQDGVAEGVGGQFGKGGLLGGVGEITSKEGVNRAERGDTGPAKGWGETLTGGVFGGGGKK